MMKLRHNNIMVSFKGIKKYSRTVPISTTVNYAYNHSDYMSANSIATPLLWEVEVKCHTETKDAFAALIASASKSLNSPPYSAYPIKIADGILPLEIERTDSINGRDIGGAIEWEKIFVEFDAIIPESGVKVAPSGKLWNLSFIASEIKESKPFLVDEYTDLEAIKWRVVTNTEWRKITIEEWRRLGLPQSISWRNVKPAIYRHLEGENWRALI